MDSTIAFRILLYVSMASQVLIVMSDPGRDCPAQCSCNFTTGIISCSNNNLKQIPDFGASVGLIKQLQMTNNTLTLVNNDTFVNFTELEVLELDRNNITQIQTGSFTVLKKLRRLKLSSNLLTILKSGTFRNMPQLEYLILNLNLIENIEKNTFMQLPKLKNLQLSFNRLSHLSDDVVDSLPALHSLYLKKNSLQSVPNELLKKMPYLDFLVLDNNSVSAIDEFAFSGCPKLKSLHLSFNKIKDIHIHAFSISVTGSTVNNLSLATLHMASNRLKDIPSAILSLSYLKTLDLSANLFKTIKPFSLLTLSSLRTLHMARNNELVYVQGKAFAGLKQLTYLYFSNNRLLQYISADAFPDSKIVDTVFLESNDLRNLSRDLLVWDNVRTLFIGMNRFVCSCDIIWLKRSRSMWEKGIVNPIKETKCFNGNKTKNILELDAEKLNCNKNLSRRSTKSRLITGLIAASVVSFALILCLFLVSCRRKFYTKYIYFKYRRQRDDPLFTVEDPKSKRKIFSGKTTRLEQDSREETLM